jgi:hypothetical protein
MALATDDGRPRAVILYIIYQRILKLCPTAIQHRGKIPRYSHSPTFHSCARKGLLLLAESAADKLLII